MNKLLAVILLVASVAIIGCATLYEPASPVAYGRNWEILSITTDGQQHFVDPASITVVNSIARADVRTVNATNEFLGKMELQCDARQARILNIDSYDREHRLLQKDSSSQGWTSVTMDSPLSAFIARYCPTRKNYPTAKK